MSKVTHLTPDRGSDPGRQKSDGTEYGSAGEALRAARERRGDDLSVVARALRIRKDHLAALEENRLEALPGRTYALGFVRSYADYLGLDANACAERFRRETAGRSDGTPQVGLFAEPEPLVVPYGKVLTALLIALIVLYGGYYLFRSTGTHAPPPVAPVPARMGLASPPLAHPIAHRPNTAPPAPAAAPPSSPAQEPGLSGTVASSAPPEASPPGQTFGMQNKNVRVILHVRAATHLLVQGPAGRVYINRILHPGDTYRVPNVVGLLLTAPDGGAVSLELDGQDMGLAGRPGQMAEALSLDPQAIVDRSAAAKRG